MILINDIRISNLLHYYKPLEEEKQILKVNGIYFNEGCYWIQSSEYADINDNGLMAIPITSEWLERCGFNWASVPYDGDENNRWSLKAGGYEFASWNGCDIELDDNKIPHIIFVHQLQNLYYALTGDELEIINV